MKPRSLVLAITIILLAAGLGYFASRPRAPLPRVAAPADPTATRASAPPTTAPAPPLGKDGFPAVSLHVKDALLPDVVDQLKDQMNGTLSYGRVPLTGGAADGTYTLDVSNRTFWEIVGLLDDQRLINVHERNGDLSLDENAPSAGAHAVSGPFFLQVFERPIPQSTPPSLGMQFVFLADPRLKVTSVSYSFSAKTTRRGSPVAFVRTFMPLSGTPQTRTQAGASASGFLQHAWESDVTDVVSLITASATYTLESGAEKPANFQLQVGQPPH